MESLGTADSSQASLWRVPVNKSGSLVIPAGRWRVEYAAEQEVTRESAGALDAFATLSTAANSEVDKEATTKIGIGSGVSMMGSVCLGGYVLDLAVKGTYYLNCKTGQAFDIGHCVQGQRAEDEDTGGVRILVIVVLASRTKGRDLIWNNIVAYILDASAEYLVRQ